MFDDSFINVRYFCNCANILDDFRVRINKKIVSQIQNSNGWGGGGGVAMQNNIFVIRFLQLIESVLDWSIDS